MQYYNKLHLCYVRFFLTRLLKLLLQAHSKKTIKCLAKALQPVFLRIHDSSYCIHTWDSLQKYTAFVKYMRGNSDINFIFLA